MEQAAISILKIMLKLGVVVTAASAFVVILGLATKMAFTNINGNVLTDIMALIQIWLPFDLSVVTVWATVGSSAYIAYRLTLIALEMINVTFSE